ncbi:MBL fold metallo-hydrolase [Roseovarius sp. 2305UL8-3]|uniref:MBL fold metallo-hydrolase n=1 Tax=Roseovarius conchicola TaxID=3121636 RepID=UPI00352934E2
MTARDAFNPPVGVAETLGPGLRRILAPNPSPMTYRGTNTYLLGDSDLAVIDPGPDDPAHLAAILGVVKPGQRITHILVTHSHLDHSPLAPVLASRTGAPVLAYGNASAGRSAVMQDLAAAGLARGGEGVDQAFQPDIVLVDKEIIEADGWRLTAHWTPGHFGNHMSFEWGDVVFTGDIVMGWASSLVSPPDGDLTDFMASCRKLQTLSARTFHSGHGAPITDPAARLDWLITHRLTREASILGTLANEPGTVSELTQAIYTDTPPALMHAAGRNVLAHLIDLHGRALVHPNGPLSETAQFHLA